MSAVEISARELCNDVYAVLGRVERGERLRITVDGRAVAELVPLSDRPRTVSWRRFSQEFARADPGLADELREMAPDTTDDLPL